MKNEEYQRLAQDGEQESLGHPKEPVDAIIVQNMKTAFIGALASFEEHFGELWGHGRRECDLSEVQMAYRNIWSNARTRILDIGNCCLRAVIRHASDSSTTLRS